MNKNVFRVDKFSVPAPARQEFLSRVLATHQVLRSQAGFVREAILEQTSGPGKFNFVTIVEWENAAAMEPARQVVAALHRQMNFDAREMVARLGIRADIADYQPVEEGAGAAR